MSFPQTTDFAISRIWQLPGPAKWLSFLWLARRDRLHTKKLRWQRGLSLNPWCERCSGSTEDTLHILCDCSYANAIWRILVPSALLHDWSNLSLLEWIDTNIQVRQTKYGLRYPWFVIFVAVLWFHWRWRCQALFDEDFELPRAPLTVIMHDVRDVCRVGWALPPSTWVKLNTDGAAKDSPVNAGFGGVVRDEKGEWVLGFAGNIGVCSVLITELEAIRTGLLLAWDKGCLRVIVESDSQTALSLILGELSSGDQIEVLIKDIKQLALRNWELQWHHQYREDNKVADCLANVGVTSVTHLLVFTETPSEVTWQLHKDKLGVTY